MERKQRRIEAERAVNPSLFIVFGLSGAGLTTSVNQLHALRLAEPAPPQFVTRSLRPNERFGDYYYPVTNEVLAKVPQQIALQSEFYGNTYGFFLPAIKHTKRILDAGKNVVVDTGNLPTEWEAIIGDQHPVVSLFFAPQDPFTCIDRIIHRAQSSSQVLSIDDLMIRALGNRQNVARISEYEYWVDTTEFADVFPVTSSIVKMRSFNETDGHPKIQRVEDATIPALIERFSVDPEPYCRQRLSEIDTKF